VGDAFWFVRLDIARALVGDRRWRADFYIEPR
jgi:hypothetical protein